MSEFTHLDSSGEARMVDVTDKTHSDRVARAEAVVRMQRATLDAIAAGEVPKGDVFAVARVAGIQAAKRTADLIPLCHPLALTQVGIEFARTSDTTLQILTHCRVNGPTGVEMEALTAATVAALTVYDMCKSADRGLAIETVRLVHKSGGKSGTWDAAGRL